MAFKLGSERREYRTPNSIGGNNVLHGRKLENGVVAEANNDGTIFIDPRAPMDSDSLKRTIKHEAKHLQDMETGRSAYGDEWVMWEDKIYLRRTIDGQKVIDGPAGRLPEGHPDHPWEQSAIKAETDSNVTMEVQDISISEAGEPGEYGEPGDSPHKGWLSKAWKKVKKSKVGKFIGGGGLLGAGVRAVQGKEDVWNQGEEGEGEGEGEALEGMEPDARAKAIEAMGMMKGKIGGGGLWGGMMGGGMGGEFAKAYKRLKEEKARKKMPEGPPSTQYG